MRSASWFAHWPRPTLATCCSCRLSRRLTKPYASVTWHSSRITFASLATAHCQVTTKIAGACDSSMSRTSTAPRCEVPSRVRRMRCGKLRCPRPWQSRSRARSSTRISMPSSSERCTAPYDRNTPHTSL